MEQFNDSIIFTFHILLFGAKIWLVYSIASAIKLIKNENKTMKMMIFATSNVAMLLLALLIVFVEFWFLANFYNPVSLEFYEELNIVDQIALTAFVIQILKGGK